MFQDTYIIQFSAVFVVFLLWFLTSFALRFFQFSGPKATETTTTENGVIVEKDHFRSSVAAERTLLDGFLLLSIGVAYNVFAQGNKTSGDVLSLIIMFSLFFMTIFHYIGKSSLTFGLWILISSALLGLFITPFATRSFHLGYYDVAAPVIVANSV